VRIMRRGAPLVNDVQNTADNVSHMKTEMTAG
jgi:hypothetical protein